MVYDNYDNDRTECGTDSGIAPPKDEQKSAQ